MFFFWDLPRGPAPLCDHGLLFFVVDVRTTITTVSWHRREGGRLGAWVSFCFRGFLLSGKFMSDQC